MANDLTLKVTLTGDGRQLTGTLQTASGEVREFGTTTEREGGRAEKALEGTGREAQSVSGHLSEMNRVAAVAVTTLLGLVGIRGMASEWNAVVNETEQLERNLFRTQQLIETTGRSASRSAEQMMQQARALALSTLQSTEGVMTAQQTLLTFRGITGDIFDETIEGALDLAAAMNMDLNSAVMQIAKALENPVAGLSALSRSGTVFTETQKEMVRQMVETGRIADAQRFILDELAAQYGGVAATEALGLAGAQDTLGQAMQEARLGVGDYLQVGDRLASFYNTMADRVFAFNDALAAGDLDGHIALLTGASGAALALAAAYGTLTVAKASATIATQVFTAALRVNPIVALGTAAVATAGALYAARGAMITFGDTSARLHDWMRGTWVVTSELLATSMGSAMQEVQRSMGGLTDYLGRAWDWMSTTFVALMGNIGSIARTVINSVIGYFRTLGEVTAIIAGTIRDGFRNSFENVLALGRGFWQGMQSIFRAELDFSAFQQALDNAFVNPMIEASGEIATAFHRNLSQDYLGGSIDWMGEAIRSFGDDVSDAAFRFRFLRNEGEDAGTTFDELGLKIGDGQNQLNSLSKDLLEAGQSAATAASQTNALTRQLEQLRARYQPIRAAHLQTTQAMNTLSLAYATGRISLQEYLELVWLLQEAHMEVADQAEETAAKVGYSFTTWEEVALNSLRRVDSAGQDLWLGLVDGSRNASDTMKRMWQQTVAEIMHMLTTQRIAVAAGGMLGIGGSGAAMAGQGGGGMGSLTSLGSSAMGLARDGYASAMGSIRGAWEIGAQHGFGEGFSAFANSGFGSGAMGLGGGLLGGWASGQVFGNSREQQWGSALGGLGGHMLIPIPGLGGLAGSFIGGALGSVFGRERSTPHATFETMAAESESQWGWGRSALADGFGSSAFHGYRTGDEQDALRQVFDGVIQLDNAIAGVALPDQVDALRDRLADYSVQIRGLDGMTVLLTDRVSVIGDTLGNQLLEEIEALSDPGEMAAALISSTALSNALAEIGGTALDEAMAHIRADAEQGQMMASLAAMTDAAQTMALLQHGSERLGIQFDATAAGAIHAANELNHLVGGLDNLQARQQAYYQAFFSESERLSHHATDMAAALAAVADGVPGSVQAYSDLVEAQDLNTAAGRELYTQLLDLGPAFKEVITGVERLITQAYQDDLGRAPDADGLAYWIAEVASGALTLEQALDLIATSVEATTGEVAASAADLDKLLGELRQAVSAENAQLRAERDATVAIHRAQEEAARAALQLSRETYQAEQAAERERYQAAVDGVQALIDAERSVNAERMAALNEQRQAISSSLADTRSVARSLGQALSRLGLDTPDELRMQRAQARDALEGMRGGAVDRGVLDNALASVTQDSQHLFSTWTDWAREQGQTANLVAELEREAVSQLTLDEQQLEALERQIDSAASHHDRLMATYAAELTQMAEEHDAVMEALAQQYGQQQAAYERQIASHREAISQARDHHDALQAKLNEQLTTMQRQVDYAQGAWSATRSVDESVRALRSAILNMSRDDDLPGYADGGIARGPMTGYRVELHGAEAVIPLKNGSVPVTLNVPMPSPPASAPLRELAELLKEFRQMREEQRAAGRAIADHTSRTSQLLERWERMGSPASREERV